MPFYDPKMRELQDRYEGRAVADRLEQVRRHDEFTEADRAMIAQAPFFFLATYSETSVDCSFKGGAPGFVRVTGRDAPRATTAPRRSPASPAPAAWCA